MTDGSSQIDPLVTDAVQAMHDQPSSIGTAERTAPLATASQAILRRTHPGLDHQSAQYREQMVRTVFLLAVAHENTAATFAWAIWLLSHRPGFQDTARTSGLSDNAKAVIWETLRLYPPQHSLLRAVSRDSEMGGTEFRHEDTVLLALYAAHRHRRTWSDADSFLPERFLRDRQVFSRPTGLLSFGLGEFGCIGQQFALTTLNLALLAFLERLRFSPAAQLRPTAFFALRPEGRDAVQIEATR